MFFHCCLLLKKRKKCKKRKNSISKQGLTVITNTTEPIKSSISNKNVITNKEIEPLKNDTFDNTEYIVPGEEGNISINTSVAAITALSSAPDTEEHSYYVIDYTNVSSLERDHLKDNYDSLQISSTPSNTPSIHSNKKSLTKFQSAISLESTESFFTTASSDNNNNSSSNRPLSKNTSVNFNTNYTSNNNSIRVNNRHSISKTKSFLKLRKSQSFFSIKSNRESIKDNEKTDTNATVSNIVNLINKNNELSTYSTDITVNNLIVYTDTNNDNTSQSMIPKLSKELYNNPNNTIDSIEKKENLSNSTDVTPFLETKSKIEKTILTENDLDQIAERALHPDLTQYTLDSVIKNRIKVYSRVRPSTGINEYIILGYLDKVTLREAYDVYMNLEYRKEWDDLKQQINLFSRKDNKSSQSVNKNDLSDFEIHWEIKLPWPFSNREYIFERNTYEHKYNNMIFLVADNSSLNNNQEINTGNENSRTIRITEYEQMTVFYSDSEDGKCNVYMEYYDDPKGNIPLVLKNWVVSRAAPNFITNIEKACKEYKAFEKRLKNNKHIKELNDLLEKSLQQAFDDFEL